MDLDINEKKEIERIVTTFYENFDIANKDDIDIVSIACQKGFTVQRLNMGKDLRGMLLYDETHYIAGTRTNKLIVIKKGLSEEQSRYILARELGHYSLRGDKKSLVHRDCFYKNNNLIEDKVDFFARSILMPKKLIIGCVNELKKRNVMIMQLF